MSRYDKERYLYAIFTLDENKKIDGVYVGSTNDIKARIDGHLSDKRIVGKQNDLHEIMRTGSFIVRELNEVDYKSRWREYEWIRFFQDYTNLKIYNTFINCLIDKEMKFKEEEENPEQ